MKPWNIEYLQNTLKLNISNRITPTTIFIDRQRRRKFTSRFLFDGIKNWWESVAEFKGAQKWVNEVHGKLFQTEHKLWIHIANSRDVWRNVAPTNAWDLMQFRCKFYAYKYIYMYIFIYLNVYLLCTSKVAWKRRLVVGMRFERKHAAPSQKYRVWVNWRV